MKYVIGNTECLNENNEVDLGSIKSNPANVDNAINFNNRKGYNNKKTHNAKLELSYMKFNQSSLVF